MNDDKSLIVIEQKEVAFYDDQIVAVRVENGTVYVPIRPICDLLGVAWQPQARKLNSDPILSEVAASVTIRLQVTDNRGSIASHMLALPLDYLNGWLFGINANRVKNSVRDSLLKYQRECYRVLFNAFQAGELSTDATIDNIAKIDPEAAEALAIAEAVVRLARSHARLIQQVASNRNRLDAIEAQLSDTGRFVTLEQAQRISEAVKSVAFELGKATSRNEHQGVYMELYRRYGVPSYRELPAAKFDDCISWLRQWYESLTDGEAAF